MTEDQANRITALAIDVERKRNRYELLAGRNAANMNREERERATAAYHLTHAEYIEAEALLMSAKLSVIDAPAV